MIRFRRSLTIRERQKIRAAVLARELAKAGGRAARYRRSVSCTRAMDVMTKDPAQAREQHALCKDEEPGGPGCLCECHDTVTGELATGVAGTASPPPSAFLGEKPCSNPYCECHDA